MPGPASVLIVNMTKLACFEGPSQIKVADVLLQAVEMFIDEKIGYLEIMKYVEKCCDVHRQELVEAPSLEDIVHYDDWARKWVAQNAGKQVAMAA